jgi:hypothetical protein
MNVSVLEGAGKQVKQTNFPSRVRLKQQWRAEDLLTIFAAAAAAAAAADALLAGAAGARGDTTEAAVRPLCFWTAATLAKPSSSSASSGRNEHHCCDLGLGPRGWANTLLSSSLHWLQAQS